jgi:hypothetical protein
MPLFVRRALFAAMTISTLSACSTPETWEFKEQVLLNTGETVVISHEALRNNVFPHMGPDGYRAVVHQSLTDSKGGPAWEAGRHVRPVSWDVVDGGVFVTASDDRDPNYCLSHPDAYRIAIWRLSAGGWHEVPRSDRLLDTLLVNLLVDPEWGDSSERRPLVTVAEKAERERHQSIHFHTIRDFAEQVGKCRVRTLAPTR